MGGAQVSSLHGHVSSWPEADLVTHSVESVAPCQGAGALTALKA
jgi:hypothetical protein